MQLEFVRDFFFLGSCDGLVLEAILKLITERGR